MQSVKNFSGSLRSHKLYSSFSSNSLEVEDDGMILSETCDFEPLEIEKHENLSTYANVIEQECLDQTCLKWVEIDELKDIGLSGSGSGGSGGGVLDELFQSKTANTLNNYHFPRCCSKTPLIESRIYGELIALGYRSYQVAGNQNLIPVGTANDNFLLQSKERQVEIKEERSDGEEKEEEKQKQSSPSIIMKPNMIYSNKNYYPARGMTEVRFSPNYESLPVEVYQIGRSESGINDWIVRGITDVGQGRTKGSVSRYSCRVVCHKESSHACQIFAGGFDESQELVLPKHSLQWKEEDNTYDGFTPTGIHLWHPVQKIWSEVSIKGNLYGPRKSFKISEHIKSVPGERMRHLTNELMDGSIIDVGGCLLLFKSADVQISSSSSGELNCDDQKITSVSTLINNHRPQCPVLFQPLQFSEISLKEKQHRMWKYIKTAHHKSTCSRNTMAPECFFEDPKSCHSSTPYVFSSCGHVYGYSKELEGRPCPMCRKIGPYVPLLLSTENAICSKNPTHVFNPCGHATSLQICQQWSQTPLPELIRSSESKYSSSCPFCLTKLDPSNPFAKLIIMFDEK